MARSSTGWRIRTCVGTGPGRFSTRWHASWSAIRNRLPRWAQVGLANLAPAPRDPLDTSAALGRVDRHAGLDEGDQAERVLGTGGPLEPLPDRTVSASGSSMSRPPPPSSPGARAPTTKNAAVRASSRRGRAAARSARRFSMPGLGLDSRAKSRRQTVRVTARAGALAGRLRRHPGRLARLGWRLMLRIRLLGELCLELEGRRLDAIASRRARSLLAWLAYRPGLHPRTRVAAVFWPDVLEGSARASLRNTLSVLRRELGEDAGGYVVAERERVGIVESSQLWVDVPEIDRLVAAGGPADRLGVCGGELLVDLDDDWGLEARGAHPGRVGELF